MNGSTNGTHTYTHKLTTNDDYINLENEFCAHNYKSMPVVFESAKGCVVKDVEGNTYLDFLAGYSAVNQGHCHPKIIQTLIEQSQKLTLPSRAFHSNLFGPYAQFITHLFGYDKVLPMNTGVEAGETAIKLCRKWGYYKKNIPNNMAKIIMCKNNFWGRTIAACSSSSDPTCSTGYGPFTPGFELIEYNNLQALHTALEDPNVAGFYVEPIQGEGGVIVPADGYLKAAHEMCKAKNVLLVCDEIQTGLGRCGTMLASDHDGVKPDILVLGKALSGGVLPVSAILANNDIMLCIEPGTHGSTYGGNPLACAVAMSALKVILDENLVENSKKMGQKFRSKLTTHKFDFIKEIRGRGLFNAIELDENKIDPWFVCVSLNKNGILCKTTHDNIIRFSPPLVISEEQMDEALDKITHTFQTISKK